MKRLSRNIYKTILKKEDFISLIIFILGLSATYDLIKFYYKGEGVELLIVILSIIAFIIKVRLEIPKTTTPFLPQQQFIGLYCLEEDTALSLHYDNGLISRYEEVKCLQRLIKGIENSNINDSSHRAICLIGKSGCGKSTVLFELENNEFIKKKLWYCKI